MSLVKQTHELPCPDETVTRSYHLRLPQVGISDIATINTPWKVEAKWIRGSKPFRKEVAQAKARSEFLKASAIQRSYLPSTVR